MRRQRGSAARASVGSCRDKISERRDMIGEIEGTSKIVFLGAEGTEVEVECPKVTPRTLLLGGPAGG